MIRRPPTSTLFPYTTSSDLADRAGMMVSPKAARELGDKLGTRPVCAGPYRLDRKSTRLNSSHLGTSYAVLCLKKITRLTEGTGAQATKAQCNRDRAPTCAGR